MVMTYIIYFSPAGGTLKVAQALCDAWKPEIEMIDLTDAERDYSGRQFLREDICIVAAPSYGGRVPAAAVERLSRMHAKGSRAAAVVVYGNRDYDDTLLELKDTLEKAGFHVDALVTAVAQHSVAVRVAAGRPDKEDLEELKGFGAEIKKQWESGGEARACLKIHSRHLHAPLRGIFGPNSGYIARYAPFIWPKSSTKWNAQLTESNFQTRSRASLTPKGNYPYRVYKGIPLKPKAGKTCASCGLCASKCPVGAISKENPKDTDKGKCISCMRYINICPVHARKVNSLLLKAAGGILEKSCKERKKNTCLF